MHYCKKDLFTIKKIKKDESNNSKNIRKDRSNPKKQPNNIGLSGATQIRQTQSGGINTIRVEANE